MTKKSVRARLRAGRGAMSVFDVEGAAANLAEWMYRLPIQLDEGATVACYLPLDAEPGSDAMLDALTDQGYRVIVPVVPEGPPQPLHWAVYDTSGPLVTGRWGISAPASPALGPEGLREAKAVFVPALAVARDGARLGRGGGYYDRSLPGSTAVLIAVVYDAELVDELPVEPTDIPMTWALTPQAGFTRLDG